MFFQTSWNTVPSGQQSHCHRGLLCVFLWNPICELLLFLLTTTFPGQTTQTSLAPNLFLSSFWEMMQCDVERMLFHVTPTPRGPNWPASETNTGLTKAHRRWAKPLCPPPKGLLLRPGKGGSEISVGQQTALLVTKGRTILQWNFWKAIWLGARLCCWSAAHVLMSSMSRAMGQQETPKHWTGPHTHHVPWHGWKWCSPSYWPKPSDYKTRH